ncbi:Arc family DNA-binding protein [Ciceribacter selenitireducens]
MKDQFPLRLPNGMRDRIKEAAEKNLRTMNSEIIYQLSQAYGASTETKKADVPA